MREIKRDTDTPLFVPDFMAKSIADIDFGMLKNRGVKYVAFDADSTLVPYRSKEIELESSDYLKIQLKMFEDYCIASNRVTNDLHVIAKALDTQVIRATWFTRKPAKAFFEKVISHFDAKPHEIAMIGDKLVADIYGANRMGFVSVWLEKLGRDSIQDRVFRTRQIEARMMRKYLK